MKLFPLSAEETRQSSYTHKAIFSYALGDLTVASTSATITLGTLPIGTQVLNAAYKAVTEVTGGATSACTYQLGVTGTTNAFITATSIHASSSPVDYKAGDGASFNQAGGYVATAAIALIITLTATGANLSALTQGEVHTYLELVDLTKI